MELSTDHRRFDRRQFLIAAGLLGLAGTGSAQNQFGHQIVLVVPQTPGGAVDTLARSASKVLTQETGVPAIVINKPGAAGEIAAVQVANPNPADGTTLLMGNSSSMVVNPQVRKTRFDPVKDFRPLGGIVLADTLIVTNPQRGFSTLQEVIAAARKKPGQLPYASNGVGGAFHLAMEYFQALTDIKLLHVPFGGATDGQIALMSDQVGLMVTNTVSALPHIRSGKIVPLAVLSSKRSDELPQLALASEIVPRLEANTWVGAYAPSSMDEARARRLNTVFTGYLSDPGAKPFFRANGLIPVPGGLEQAEQWMQSELKTWQYIISVARQRGPIE